MDYIKLLSVLANGASRFLRNGLKLKSLLYDFISDLGPLLTVDRIYVFKNHMKDDILCMSQYIEWCAPGIIPQINNENLQNVAYEPDREYLLDYFLNEQPWFTNIVEEGADKLLLEQNIESICLFPVYSAKHILWGFIGFDDCKHANRTWSDLELYILNISANLIGDCIWRIQKEYPDINI